jgi:hypothetical protein
MLIIRHAQLEALSAGRSREFEHRALAHLRRWMPRHCELLGEEQMRRVVVLGWAKARRYGLGAECTVLGVLDLMCLLGSGFDDDPLLPWAAPILNEPPRIDAVERGDRLYDAAWAYIHRIALDYRDAEGVAITERLIGLLREARAAPRTVLADESVAAWADTFAETLTRFFPAKAAFVGPAALTALAGVARARARSHGLVSVRGVHCIGVLMFILGAGFDDDPLLPWIPPILSAAEDEQTRLDRLFASGAATLRRWWDLDAAARQ